MLDGCCGEVERDVVGVFEVGELSEVVDADSCEEFYGSSYDESLPEGCGVGPLHGAAYGFGDAAGVVVS